MNNWQWDPAVETRGDDEIMADQIKGTLDIRLQTMEKDLPEGLASLRHRTEELHGKRKLLEGDVEKIKQLVEKLTE